MREGERRDDDVGAIWELPDAEMQGALRAHDNELEREYGLWAEPPELRPYKRSFWTSLVPVFRHATIKPSLVTPTQ